MEEVIQWKVKWIFETAYMILVPIAYVYIRIFKAHSDVSKIVQNDDWVLVYVNTVRMWVAKDLGKYSKTCLKRPLKKKKKTKKYFKPDHHLMPVITIAECCNTFDIHLATICL